MKRRIESTNPDILGSWPALRRAARRAWRLSVATRTPFYVFKDGKVVNLNPKARRLPRSAGR